MFLLLPNEMLSLPLREDKELSGKNCLIFLVEETQTGQTNKEGKKYCSWSRVICVFFVIGI